MKLISVSLLALASVFCVPQAAAIIENPMTRAVIAVYDQQLRANPNDYNTWFRRANEYYRHNEYVQALDDVNQCLATAPASDKDLRFQAYMLRAGIYNMTGKPEMALPDLDSAVALDPESASAV